MLEELPNFAHSIPGFKNWSDNEKIRFFGWYMQTQIGKERFSTPDIRRCFEILDFSLPSNISSSLKQMVTSRAPQMLKDNKGYRLEGAILETFNKKFKPTRTANTDFPTPDFSSLVSDAELARILKLRWGEAHINYESKAYLSTIIMLGSILEGLLLAKMKDNPRQANTAHSCPKDSSGKAKYFSQWTLDELIHVAHECGWLDKDVKDFSSALRGYRNLIHPNQQLVESVFPTQSTCRISWEVVNAAIAHVSR